MSDAFSLANRQPWLQDGRITGVSDMTCYAIGIGGTGARCVEAMLHLCAAGMFPRNSDSLVIGLVDPDQANGSVTRTLNVLQRYIRARGAIGEGRGVFPVAVTAAAGEIWSVLDGRDARRAIDNIRFDAVFDKEELAQSKSDSPIADLMDVLFTHEEQSFTLEVGFRGKPSLGSAIFAKDGDLDQSPFWQNIFARLMADASNRTPEKPDRIILFGSIFGGTGAAGLPTLTHLIHTKLTELKILHVEIAVAVLLPYFTFQKPQDQVAADATEFIENTRNALEFYGQGTLNEFLDDLYFIGEPVRCNIDKEQSAISGPKQRNPAHMVEFCSALAAIDFFGVRRGGVRVPGAEARVHFASRATEGTAGWSDLPFDETDKLRGGVVQLVRFTIALNCLFAPMLREIQAKGNGTHAPWFVDLFGKQKDAFRTEHEAILNHVMAYSDEAQGYTEFFLEWIEQISGGQQQATKLLDLAGIAYHGKKLDVPAAVGNEVLNRIFEDCPAADRLALATVWNRVCEKADRLPRDKPVSSLVQAIFEGCAL